MKVENTLAKSISAAGDKAAYDAACKRLLANKMILAWIMKSCLEEYRDFPVKEIAEKYIEGEPQIAGAAVNPGEEVSAGGGQIRGANSEDCTISEGTIAYDIRFYAVVPQTDGMIRLIVNVEGQNEFYPGYPIIKRGIYYCSRMISAQYGTEFADAHYERIRKVYSVWVCANPPKYRENTITRYALAEEHLVGNVKEKKENYDLLTAVMICLGRAGDDNYSGILKLLGVLLSHEKPAEEKKAILEDEFEIEMTRMLESEVQTMCNLSKGVEERGIVIGMERGMKQGMERGMKQGMEQGMERGIECGMETAILDSIRNLMETLKLTADQAMAALKVPEAKQREYARKLDA